MKLLEGSKKEFRSPERVEEQRYILFPEGGCKGIGDNISLRAAPEALVPGRGGGNPLSRVVSKDPSCDEILFPIICGLPESLFIQDFHPLLRPWKLNLVLFDTSGNLH